MTRRSVAIVLIALSVSACGSKSSPTSPSPQPTPQPTTFTLSGGVSETPPTAINKIPGATVTIADGANAGKSATADGAGNFTLSNLQAGGFTVNVAASGYQSKSVPVTLNASISQTFQLAPVFQLLDNQIDDEVNGGSPICPDFFTTSRNPCKAYPLPVHNAGRITAVLTWTGSHFGFAINDLDLALMKDPRSNPDDRIVISRGASTLREEVSADAAPGIMYWIHVLYNNGSTAQRFTLRITRPN